MKSNKLFGLAALVLALSGCKSEPKYVGASETNETIKGVPISVAESFSQYTGGFAVVLERDGKPLLASEYNMKDADNQSNAEAVALVQSEISDNDSDSIEVIGKYVGNKFAIKKIKAHGYEVAF